MTDPTVGALERVLNQLLKRRMQAAEKQVHWESKGEKELSDYYLGIYSGINKGIEELRREIAFALYSASVDEGVAK